MFNTSSNCTAPLHCSHIPESQTFLFLLMIVEVVVGLPGNLLALWIVCFRMKVWKPHTVFLFNLMLADIFLLAAVPFRIDTYLREEDWVYGKVFCRINLFMLAINRSGSIAFMTTVALNRYFHILHPLHCISSMSSRHAVWLSVFIWAIVMIVRLPLLTIDLILQQDGRNVCHGFHSYQNPPWQMKVHYAACVTEFLLPWILLIFCSVRIFWFLKRRERVVKQKKREFKTAIRSVAVINVVFMICFLPAIVTGLASLAIEVFDPHNCESFKKMVVAFKPCVGLTYLNSALDPVIYSFSSFTFWTALKDVFKSLRR